MTNGDIHLLCKIEFNPMKRVLVVDFESDRGRHEIKKHVSEVRWWENSSSDS